jgi:hypothetical protein
MGSNTLSTRKSSSFLIFRVFPVRPRERAATSA